MNKLAICLFLGCLTFSAVSSEKRLPETFKRCGQNDPGVSKCLMYSVPYALRLMKNGIPELKVPKLEPLEVSEIDINTGSGPVNIRQLYKNIKIYGITDANLTTYNADLKNYRIITDSYNDKVEFTADYVMDGRILLIPLAGKGRCNITMKNLVIKHDLIGEPVTKNGKIYMKLKDYKVKFITNNVSFYFHNLFNGNKALGEQMNRFMNENSEIVFQELKGSYEKSFSIIFKDITNKIFTKVPFDDIFPTN